MSNSSYHKIHDEAVYLKLTKEELYITLYGVAALYSLISDGKHQSYAEALKVSGKTLDSIIDKHKDVPSGKVVSFTMKRGMLCDITRGLLCYADCLWKAGKNSKLQDDLRYVWKKLHEQREQHEIKATEKGWR